VHPLMRALEAIRQVQEIVLASLLLDDIVCLVADALHRARERAPFLAAEDRRKSIFRHPVLTRASQINGKSDIYTSASHRTSIVLAVPIPL
jgi:hypothetical protein